MNNKTILPRRYSDALMKSSYARVAWFYDAWGRLTEDKALNRLLALAEVADGMDILEVAVGTGRLFEKLVARNPSGNNQGVDIAPAMLAYAKRRLARHAERDAYQLQEGSAYQLPFAPDSFDRLFNSYMLDMFPLEDHARVLSEFLRVLRPGGVMAIGYFSHGHRWFNRLWPWLAKHFPALLTYCRPVDLLPTLEQLGVVVLAHETLSQNSFPSDIVIVQKPR